MTHKRRWGRSGTGEEHSHHLPNPQLEALGLVDEEPNFHDMMKMLGNITTKLAPHQARMEDITSHMVIMGAMAYNYTTWL